MEHTPVSLGISTVLNIEIFLSSHTFGHISFSTDCPRGERDGNKVIIYQRKICESSEIRQLTEEYIATTILKNLPLTKDGLIDFLLQSKSEMKWYLFLAEMCRTESCNTINAGRLVIDFLGVIKAIDEKQMNNKLRNETRRAARRSNRK